MNSIVTALCLIDVPDHECKCVDKPKVDWKDKLNDKIDKWTDKWNKGH